MNLSKLKDSPIVYAVGTVICGSVLGLGLSSAILWQINHQAEQRCKDNKERVLLHYSTMIGEHKTCILAQQPINVDPFYQD